MTQVKTDLQANSFGWVGQFFQSISHMAPAAAVILSVPFMALRAGSALPLAILFAMVLAMAWHGGHYVGGYHCSYYPSHTGALVWLPLWGSVYYNQTLPTAYAPYMVVVWFVIGLFVYAWLRRNRPNALKSLEAEMDKLVH